MYSWGRQRIPLTGSLWIHGGNTCLWFHSTAILWKWNRFQIELVVTSRLVKAEKGSTIPSVVTHDTYLLHDNDRQQILSIMSNRQLHCKEKHGQRPNGVVRHKTPHLTFLDQWHTVLSLVDFFWPKKSLWCVCGHCAAAAPHQQLQPGNDPNPCRHFVNEEGLQRFVLVFLGDNPWQLHLCVDF